jgi:hypothetical protein
MATVSVDQRDVGMRFLTLTWWLTVQSKVENSKLEKAAETVTRVKDQVRRVKEKGQEKEFQEQVARNEAKAKGEEV